MTRGIAATVDTDREANFARIGRSGTRKMPDQSLPKPWLHRVRVSVRTLIKHLTLILTPVNDAGLAHLEGLSNLESLMLRGRNEVTDAGVAHLTRMIGLRELYLEDSQISDAGLAFVSGLTGLETLNLARTRIGDAGLAHLGGLTRLETLDLDGTKITDAGLPHLAGLVNLKDLRLLDTAVNGSGLEELRQALPSLTIQHAIRPGSERPQR